MKKILLALAFVGVLIVAGCSGSSEPHDDGDDHEHSAAPVIVWNA